MSPACLAVGLPMILFTRPNLAFPYATYRRFERRRHMHGFIKGQMISPMDLPDFARDVIMNDVNLHRTSTKSRQWFGTASPVMS